VISFHQWNELSLPGIQVEHPHPESSSHWSPFSRVEFATHIWFNSKKQIYWGSNMDLLLSIATELGPRYLLSSTVTVMQLNVKHWVASINTNLCTEFTGQIDEIWVACSRENFTILADCLGLWLVHHQNHLLYNTGTWATLQFGTTVRRILQLTCSTKT
jgi:hypothetical protein